MTKTIDRLLKEFDGKIRLVYRQYPNEKNHPFAEKAAEASLCANEQGKFWEMHDLLFENINDLATDDLKAKAEKLGLAQAQFDTCLDSGKYKARAKKDYADAMRVGVSGTPSFFINGRLYTGAWPYEELVSIVKEELKKEKRHGFH
jgi:protein-disulfide isomerase